MGGALLCCWAGLASLLGLSWDAPPYPPSSVPPGAMLRSAVTEQPGSSELDDIHELHPPYESLAFTMRIDLVSAKQEPLEPA